jgi:predicted amidophosphoribosyltransferase
MILHVRDLRVRTICPLNAYSLSWVKRVKFGRLLRDSDYLRLRIWASEAFQFRDFNFDAISAIPAHPLRSLLQVDLAWEWARCLEEVSGTRLLSPALRHSSLSHSILRGPQKNFSLAERRALFESPKRRPRYECLRSATSRRVLIVDDVLNSGCSFLEAREALEAGGHRVVGGLVLTGGHAPHEI